MVKQILAFSRKNLIEKKPLYIGQIIREDLKLLRSSIPATIEIHSHIDRELNPVLADLTQIHQVIMNVFINAAHAMREQGGILEISLKEIDLQPGTFDLENIEPGIYQQLTIKDNGHGMDAETVKKIFDPYFTTKGTGEGTGMGLAVVHGIVKSHRGEIVVFSEPGKGATFHIFFPIAKTDGGQKPGTAFNKPVRGGSERIFLVDDEITLAEMGKLMLEKLGYRVTVKTNSIEALEYFRGNHHNFDILITDMTMPGITGLQLAREIHRIKAGIPVVLCTGFSEEINEENFKSRGISAFVMKPIVREQIARVIREVLDQAYGIKNNTP
jgi:CheY-like chemotaxis protein